MMMTCLITAHLDWISDVIGRKHRGVNPSTEVFHSEQQCLFMLSIHRELQTYLHIIYAA